MPSSVLSLAFWALLLLLRWQGQKGVRGLAFLHHLVPYGFVVRPFTLGRLRGGLSWVRVVVLSDGRLRVGGEQ